MEVIITIILLIILLFQIFQLTDLFKAKPYLNSLIRVPLNDIKIIFDLLTQANPRAYIKINFKETSEILRIQKLQEFQEWFFKCTIKPKYVSKFKRAILRHEGNENIIYQDDNKTEFKFYYYNENFMLNEIVNTFFIEGFRKEMDTKVLIEFKETQLSSELPNPNERLLRFIKSK